MKITIDLEDLVNEFVENASCGEYGIEDSFNLKAEIKNAIIRQVAYSNFDKEISDMREQAKNLFKARIAEKIDEVIEIQIERIIKEDKFKYYAYDDDKTLSEYIKDKYIGATKGDRINLDKITKDIATKAAEELKARYDLLFASQLVSKLGELGMLKEDAAKILLKENN